MTGILVFALIITRAVGVPVLTPLVSFNGTNGAFPYAGLIQASNGNFYGTTSGDGVNNSGSVFEVSSTGAFSNLITFDGAMDATPIGGLVQGSDGRFYGTVSVGGSQLYYGAVFRTTSAGTFTNLVSFTASSGYDPEAGLVLNTNDNYYGTTVDGGEFSSGTIFLLSPNGALTTLYSFDVTNGANPYASLIQGQDGNLYGTAFAGGAYGLGTVFKLTTAGAFTTLVSFDGTNGANPRGALVQGNGGNFYGTTLAGGANNAGTVFRMTPSGALSTLVSFDGVNDAKPYAGLVQAADGNFYGTTLAGGTHFYGAIFRLTPAGALSTLLAFDGTTNGGTPYGNLLQGTDDALYGTANQGGTGGKGVVYRITELPFITSQPAGQTVLPGEPVTLSVSAGGGFGPLSYQWFLNGTNITGATGTNLMTTNQGTYSVVVSNSFGTLTSSNALVTFPESTLALQIQGQGSVVPDLSSQSLVIGSTYTVTATPSPGWAFAYWTGSVSGIDPVLTFVMQSNFVVQANFVPTQFLPAKGNYTGLFYPGNGASPTNSGALMLTMNSRGKFTAKARFGLEQASFSGRFTNAHTVVTGHPAGNKTTQLTLSLQANLTPGTARITGTLSDGSFVAAVTGARAGISPVAPPFGQKFYTMALAPGTNAAATPGGWGALTGRLGSQGNLVLKGTLSDGTKISQSALTSTNGDFPVFVGLNRGKGMLMGWVALAGDSPNGPNIIWMKSSGQGGKQFYPNGFTVNSPLLGSLYLPPVSDASGLSLSTGVLVLSDGSLSGSPLTNSFSLVKKRFTFASNPNSVVLTLNPANGILSGTFTSPVTQKKTPITTVVLQELNQAVGFFLDSDESGQALVQGQ